MESDRDKLSVIIEELIRDIEKVKDIWSTLRNDNPGFEQVSEENWQSKEARISMHGAANIWEANALEEWLYASPPLTETAKSIAIDNYLAWEDHIREGGSYTEFESINL